MPSKIEFRASERIATEKAAVKRARWVQGAANDVRYLHLGQEQSLRLAIKSFIARFYAKVKQRVSGLRGLTGRQ
jgi:hypothetical protein